MHLIIERKNGKRYKLSKETGYIVLKFRPESIKVTRQRESVSGRPPVSIGTEIEGRPIHTEILFTSYDFFDHVLKRNEFFQILDSREEFYVISSEEPGKRWLVSTEAFTPEPVTMTLGRCELVLYSESPYAESIGKTIDPMTFDSGLWQIGQGLIAEDTKYIHNTTSFRIYNAGDETIDPKSMPLKITYKGISNNLSIKNVTTGDLWSYTGSTASENDVITLDGVKSSQTTVGSIFGKTNWGLITLKPGWNDFLLTGTSGSFEIKFDFKFYYL
ncbi:phage tail family protein [Bacillus cereus group sp. N6]|uniref:phage tail family protein n=1 Tax=Bacillus cereus group sp. N6 TaxID=2794583 RepID=UPI0018F5F7FF|nr:phage tail family protein [Bacillus cereus group sp. N6]MBJ8111726.1 phage tail family protein [Bacillus cereus group sp. N6]